MVMSAPLHTHRARRLASRPPRGFDHLIGAGPMQVRRGEQRHMGDPRCGASQTQTDKSGKNRLRARSAGSLRSINDLPLVTIAIASVNTAPATELCLRSLAAYDAGVPYRLVIGDCGSTDGSLPMLMSRVQSGQIASIELAPHGRRHAEWIDHWVSECPTTYLLMLDSDVEIRVEIRRDGWLAGMVATAEASETAMCMASLLPENPDYTDPDGRAVRLGQRPSMHCVLLQVASLRKLGRSFFVG